MQSKISNLKTGNTDDHELLKNISSRKKSNNMQNNGSLQSTMKREYIDGKFQIPVLTIFEEN